MQKKKFVAFQQSIIYTKETLKVFLYKRTTQINFYFK